MSFWRRRKPSWEDFFKDFEDSMNELMEELYRMGIERGEYQRWRKEEGSKPFVYGFSFSLGPDGKPVFREFGNVKPGVVKPRFSEEREPLVDIYEEGEHVVVLVEIPGVEKEDIELKASEDAIKIRVDNPDRKYYKMVNLPKKVSTEDVKTRYKNGVLEVKLKRKEKGWDTITFQ